MTGTRVATQIKDLPYTVNVLTSEFFEDFGMLQLDDTLTQVGGLTGLDIGGSFNLRGFSSTSQLRDGFYRLGRYGQTNVDRIEIIKGPNAGSTGALRRRHGQHHLQAPKKIGLKRGNRRRHRRTPNRLHHE